MLAELERRRDYECRLTPDRALETLDDAAAWVADRGLVAVLPSGSLPSLHVACHEEPYKPGSRGFGLYPKTRWWWSFALSERPELLRLKIHRGKGLLLHERVVPAVDPLARAALAAAEDGAHGEDARRLVEHLAAAGPSALDDVKVELGLEGRSLRAVRETLERVAAVVAVRLAPDDSGDRYATELHRWDQLRPQPSGGGIDELLLAGVRAAVLAPEREAVRWYSWPAPRGTVDRLVAGARLVRVDGLLAATTRASGS